MDAPDLSFDELKALAQDRTVWRKNMMRQDTDTASFMVTPEPQTDNKCIA